MIVDRFRGLDTPTGVVRFLMCRTSLRIPKEVRHEYAHWQLAEPVFHAFQAQRTMKRGPGSRPCARGGMILSFEKAAAAGEAV